MKLNTKSHKSKINQINFRKIKENIHQSKLEAKLSKEMNCQRKHKKQNQIEQNYLKWVYGIPGEVLIQNSIVDQILSVLNINLIS